MYVITSVQNFTIAQTDSSFSPSSSSSPYPVPCNQFASQDPQDDEGIGAFCQKNYGVSFDIMAKSDVNGSNTNEVFKFLKGKKAGLLGTQGIKWNFTKFLVDKNGNVAERYAPQAKPNQTALYQRLRSSSRLNLACLLLLPSWYDTHATLYLSD